MSDNCLNKSLDRNIYGKDVLNEKVHEEDITVEVFIQKLLSTFEDSLSNEVSGSKNIQEIIRQGRIEGWLEDEDERFSQRRLDKRSAARIVHQFMKIKLEIPDICDTQKAEVLKDLYTCRICANHIAQVFLRNMIPAEEMEYNGQIVQVFNQLATLSLDDVIKIIEKIELAKNNK